MKLIISMVHKDDFSSLDDLLALAWVHDLSDLGLPGKNDDENYTYFDSHSWRNAT
jgi:hypothetical protein